MPTDADIFYSSGTLQYLQNPMEVLERGMKSAKLIVILRRNHFANSVVFDIQRPWLWDNGEGEIPDGFPNCQVSYPRQTMIASEVVALAAMLGFSCILADREQQLVFARNLWVGLPT
jgi:hypothetical protein